MIKALFSLLVLALFATAMSNAVHAPQQNITKQEAAMKRMAIQKIIFPQ